MILTASEQHKDSCVCGAVGTRSALEALRLYLGCVYALYKSTFTIIITIINVLTAAVLTSHVAASKIYVVLFRMLFRMAYKVVLKRLVLNRLLMFCFLISIFYDVSDNFLLNEYMMVVVLNFQPQCRDESNLKSVFSNANLKFSSLNSVTLTVGWLAYGMLIYTEAQKLWKKTIMLITKKQSKTEFYFRIKLHKA